MKRPSVRAWIYSGSALGFARASEEALAEARAPHEDISPTTCAEPDAVNWKWIWVIGAGVLLTLWAIVLVLYPLFTYFKYERTGGQQPSKVLEYLPPQPPRPRNESDPFEDLERFRARETYMLTHYSWVDRDQGLVEIPIERAMDMIAKTGIAPSSAGAKEYYPPHAASMRSGSLGKVEPAQP